MHRSFNWGFSSRISHPTSVRISFLSIYVRAPPTPFLILSPGYYLASSKA
jgi:hypothetical protein